MLPPDYGTACDDIQPGTIYLNIDEFDPADPRFLSPDEDEQMRPYGATLRALRLALASQDGVFIDPTATPTLFL